MLSSFIHTRALEQQTIVLKNLGLGGSVVTNLISDLPELDGTHYHIVFDNLFTSPRLIRLLSDKGTAATGTLRPNRAEGAPLKSIDVMKKEARGSHDVVLERKAGICVVRWHDSKVFTVASSFAGVHPIHKAK